MTIIEKQTNYDKVTKYTDDILDMIETYDYEIRNLKEQIEEMKFDHGQKVDELQDKIDDLSD